MSQPITSPQDFQFRERVENKDRERVQELVSGTGFFRTDEVDIAVELVDDFLSKGPQSGYCFLFIDAVSNTASETQTLGYACFGEIPCTIGSYDLYWIAVDQTCQGQGIGKRLMQAVEEKISSLQGRHIYAETSGKDQYLPTRKFYEQCGYQTASILADFYAPGDDRVTYRKILS